MRAIDGIPVFGDVDDKTLVQAQGVKQHAEHVALMADNHLGYVMPVGGVAAYRNQVSVVGVGFDIGCGNCAIRTDLTYEQLVGEEDSRGETFVEIAEEIASTIAFGIGRTNRQRDAPVNHGLFDSADWDALPSNVRDVLRHKAINQLGTVGSGNHYVDIFADETDQIWVGVHFGSRGFGHGVASGFLALGQGAEWGERVPEQETLFDLGSELGQRYWAAMQLAGQYAYVGREYVARKVCDILGARPLEVVHNHHNFAWKEEHFGEEFVVVRKGATPAWPGQMGFVGGSMGDNAVILEGRDDGVSGTYDEEDSQAAEAQRQSLFSTVHGAGRVMSRTRAKGSRVRYNKQTGERTQQRKGEITPEMMREWVSTKGVVVRGGDVDESPHCYRRLDEVLLAQGETINVLHTLKPLIVVMAGADIIDPYKD